MVDKYNFDGYQIPHVGVTGGMTGADQQGRIFGMKISNFGALAYGNRMVSDYTRVGLGFMDKGNLENPNIPSFTMDAEYNENPYVWGSTVKKMRNDEFTVMGMGSRRTRAVDQPGFDVSDTDVAVDDGTNAPKKFPAEGWATLGRRTGGPANYKPTGA